MLISFVIPCYRSAASIGKVVDDIRVEISSLEGFSYQILLSCDASPDDTFEVIRDLCQNDDHIIGVNLSRNFGQQAARMAVLPFVKGDYVVFMDDDGQHPTTGISQLINKLEEGYDIVYARFVNKRHTAIQRFGSRVNRVMTEFLIGKPKEVVASSFFIARSYVIEKLQQYPSPNPYIFGYLMQITRNIANVDLVHQPRIAGKSGYTLKKLISLWFSGVTGFSVIPLRIASFVGFIVALLGFVYGAILIVRKLLYPDVSLGYTSLMAAILFASGLIMLMMGLVGEYIGSAYMSINNLPQFVVREVINCENENTSNR